MNRDLDFGLLTYLLKGASWPKYIFVFLKINCWLRDHSSPGGGRGGGVWKIFLCKLFFNLCTSTNIFSKCKLFFLEKSCLQAIYFVFLGPANNFSIFFIPPPLQKNNGPSLIFRLSTLKTKHTYRYVKACHHLYHQDYWARKVQTV